jgi:hypothetical protein
MLGVATLLVVAEIYNSKFGYLFWWALIAAVVSLTLATRRFVVLAIPTAIAGLRFLIGFFITSEGLWLLLAFFCAGTVVVLLRAENARRGS